MCSNYIVLAFQVSAIHLEAFGSFISSQLYLKSPGTLNDLP